MRKSLVPLVIFAMLSSLLITLFMGAAALADEGITRTYDDITTTGLRIVEPYGNVWDLTRGDLKVSYTLDMSQFKPPQGNQDWTSVGLWGPGGAEGWLASSSPGYYLGDNAPLFDKTDMLVLRSDWPGDNDEGTYNATAPDTIVAGWPWGPLAPWNNLGIWFDRGAVDTSLPTTPPGLEDGKNFNTNGVYKVEISYHCVDQASMTNTMFATVNGIPQQMFNILTNQYITAGKSFYGDPKQVQVYVNLAGTGVKIINFSATGYPAPPQIRLVTPDFAEQGTLLKDLAVYGFQFRDVPSVVQLKNKVSTVPSINASKVTYWNSELVTADMQIPLTAKIGKYDTRFWHKDDPSAIASLPDSFTITAAPPKINAISPNHSRPNKSFTMTITGSQFRNVSMTVMLWRGGEIYKAKAVRYYSSTKVYADFTLPANAYIGSDWSVTLINNDDGKWSDLYNQFSVDAKVDVYSNGFLNLIWLRAPWIDTVVIYSEGDFDATTLWPLGCMFGGTFPIACNPADWNHDGKNDMVLYFWNMAVNLPIGRSEAYVYGADWSGRRVQGIDTVRVFWFLF